MFGFGLRKGVDEMKEDMDRVVPLVIEGSTLLGRLTSATTKEFDAIRARLDALEAKE